MAFHMAVVKLQVNCTSDKILRLFSATVRLRCENRKYVTIQQPRREYGQLTVNIFIYTVFVSVDRIKDTD